MHVNAELAAAGAATQAATPQPALKLRWPLLMSVLTAVILFFPVITKLVSQWYSDSDYSHGFVVPIFSAWVVWRKRDQLAKVARRPSNRGALIVLLSLGLLFLGSLGAELFLTRIGLLGVIIGLILFLHGYEMLRALAFPVAFLLLMIPFPAVIYNQIVFPLQLLASHFAGACLRTTHVIPVLQEGNLLILPNYTLEIVEACSGIRSLMSLLALAIAYGYMAEPRVLMRWIVAIAMIPIAVISNGFRVVGTAFVTYTWGPKAGEGFLHTFAGLTIFLIATCLILAVHRLLIVAGRYYSKVSSKH